MIQKSSEKSSEIFHCHLCDYKSLRKSQFERHLATLKHQNRENDTKMIQKFQKKFEGETVIKNEKPKKKVQQDINKEFLCDCGKTYVHKQNLYRHQKVCKTFIINSKAKNDILLKQIVEENSEIKNMLFKQFETMQEQQKQYECENKKLQTQLAELKPKIENNTINNTINNQQVNINIFLNEYCKDAITINEFLGKIKVSLDDLLYTKTKGLSDGISNIFIENLNRLSLYERPLHCTDADSETVYIKYNESSQNGDGWSLDGENKNLKKAINQAAHVQRQNLDKWLTENPDWEQNSEKQEEYVKLVKTCTEDYKEEQIIKKLCNNLYINPDNDLKE